MGFFSGKTIITVSTSTSHLVDVKDPIVEAIITAILKDGEIPKEILTALFGGMGVKLKWAQKWARENYALGLPQGKTEIIQTVTNEQLADIIATDIGHVDGCAVNRYSYTEVTCGLLLLPFLEDTREYQFRSNSIGNPPVDLDTLDWDLHCKSWNYNAETGERESCDVMETWDDILTYPKVLKIKDIQLNADLVSADITYSQWIRRWGGDYSPEGNPYYGYMEDSHTYSENVLIPDVENWMIGETVVFALYQKYDAVGTLLPEEYSWMYAPRLQTYPELNIDRANTGDEYFPVVPIRYNNVDYTDETLWNVPPDPTNLWSTSKKFLKKLDMDFLYFGEMINTNDQVGEIDNTYVMWGLDVQSEYSSSNKYLSEFFSKLHDTQVTTKADSIAAIGDPNNPLSPNNRGANATAVAGAANSGPGTGDFDEQGLDLTISYDWIETKLMSGKCGTQYDEGGKRIRTYGRPGHSVRSFDQYTIAIRHEYRWGSRGDGDLEDAPSYYYTYHPRGKLIIDRQLTPNTFKRVIIGNLHTNNLIYRGKSVDTDVLDLIGDDENHSLIIPLQYTLAESSMRLMDKNTLYADSSLMVITTWQVTKGKWYTSGFFKFLIIVVAVIIAIYTGQAWVAELATAITSGATAVMTFMMTSIVVSLAVNYAVQWLVQEFGAKLGILGAIFLTIAAVVLTQGRGTQAAMDFMMKTAQFMLQIASALINAANEFLIGEGQKIKNEYEDFMEKLEDRWEDLKTAQDLLEFKHDLDPLMFARTSRLRAVPNESPTAFFQRCLGLADNTPYVIHDEIPSYVDTRIRLPQGIPAELYMS